MENEHQNTICCADKSNLRSYDVSRFSFQSKVRGDGAEYHDDDDDEDDMLTSNTSEMFCADSILFFLAPTTSMDSVNSVQRCGANSLESSWPELGHILVWDTCTQAEHVSRAVNRTSRSCSASVLTSMEQLGSVDCTLARKFFSWVGEKQFCG